MTRLNQEGARLVADLSHSQSAQARCRQLIQKLEALQAIEQHAKSVEARLADRETVILVQKEQIDAAAATVASLSGQVRDLELAQATAEAKLAAQQGTVAELRAYLESRDRQAQNTRADRVR